MQFMFVNLFNLFLACGFGQGDAPKNKSGLQSPSIIKQGQERVVGNGKSATQGSTGGYVSETYGTENDSPLDKLPQGGSIVDRHASWGKYPEGAITLWLEAVIRVQEGDTNAWRAVQYLTIPLKNDPSWMKLAGNSYFINEVNSNNPSFRSFIIGSSPQNGYKVDLNNLRISIESDADNGSLGRKYFIESSGAERPRPISLKKSDQTGLYFINEYSSMYVDVQSPPSGQETFH